MNKKSRNTIIVSIVALAIVLITVTYAYFSARITGIESASTISLTAGRMEIVYTEGNEALSFSNIYPREEAWVTKTFTLTGYNTTELSMQYNLGINVTTNEFADGYLTYDLILVSSTGGVGVLSRTNQPINGTGFKKIGTGTFTNANGDAHNYQLKIYFKDNGLDQNDAQEAVFNASVSINEKASIISANNYTYNGTVQTGTIVQSPQYEYHYNQEFGYEDDIQQWTSNNKNLRPKLLVSSPDWYENNSHGWSVLLRNYASTSPVTERLYTSINNAPITSMAHMFSGSLATSIDLSGFDTSNVTNMSAMFEGTVVTSLDLSGFDTSSVISMEDMFNDCTATALNINNFDTSNVENMAGMFANTLATSIDVSSFDTSNVTNMSAMFAVAQVLSLDLNSFDTSNVTTMSSMFTGIEVSILDLRSFDTSNVTNMADMFKYSSISTLDLSSFDFSSVTNFTGMFTNSRISRINARTNDDAYMLCNNLLLDGNVYVNNNYVCSPAA